MQPSKKYCQYKEDICERDIALTAKSCLFFAYPSKPKTSADAIQSAIKLLSQDREIDVELVDWRELPIEGNIIFCEICEGIKKSTCVVLNTTLVNFNIMFEYGFAIGSRKAIWPIVEEGIAKEDRIYTSIKTLTTIGYSQFSNSRSIQTKIKKKKPWERIPRFELPLALGDSPIRDAMNLLYLQSIYENEPSLKITEALMSIPMRKIVDNPREVPFQPLSWYLNNIGRSYAVVIHLGSDRVEGYELHWAKCALVAGISLALGRRVLILGENVSFKPIDYHDVIKSYESSDQAEEMTKNFIWPINNIIFDFSKYGVEEDIGVIKRPKISADNLLKYIDLGYITAENEEQSLGEYFVETPQFFMALKPIHKVFIGRRGSGKTANFYMILDRFIEDKRNIVCNIKPEEWQLDEILQFIKSDLDVAKKGYLLQSLWKYMVYSEAIKSCYERIATKPIYAQLTRCEQSIKEHVESNEDILKLSFAGRLINTIRKIYEKFSKGEIAEIAVSEILHERNIHEMHDMLMGYVQESKGNCVIVIDSLDANWKLGKDYRLMADILLSLIESTQDMWRSCSKDLSTRISDKGLSLLIFLRTDIFKAVLKVAREPDKLEYELIFWKDMSSLLEIVNRRILSSLANYGIDVLKWDDILEPGFNYQDMLLFLKDNILCRPRDIIFFLQHSIYSSRYRQVNYLGMKDFANAMTEYSEHAFKSLCAESQPYIVSIEKLLYEFAGSKSVLSLDNIMGRLQKGKINKRDLQKTVDFLVESTFLGYMMEDAVFHFPITPTEVSIITQKIWNGRKTNHKSKMFKIHNAFHNSLLIEK